MDVRRARILIASIVGAGMASSLLVMPVAAACALSAPPTVAIGSPLAIEGSGFPASATVDVSLTIEAGAPDEFTVESDATGSFSINLTPEAADVGVTTIAATAGTDCAAQVVVGVGVPAPSETAEATDAPAGAGVAPPRTDTGDAVSETDPDTSSMLWLVAGLLVGLGIGGLYATRPARDR